MGRRSLLSGIFCLLVIMGAAAADFPDTGGPALPLRPSFSWSGLYGGGYLGGALGPDKIEDPIADVSKTLRANSFTAGGLAGYNYQIGMLVLGAEGDGGYDGRKGHTSYLSTSGASLGLRGEGAFVGRVRVRVGYVFNNLFLFGASGVSFADNKITITDLSNGGFNSISKTPLGWNFGIGGEYAFDSNWIARLDCIFDDYGKILYAFGALPANFDSRNVDIYQGTLRGTLEYKF